jgi:hypothetical protein
VKIPVTIEDVRDFVRLAVRGFVDRYDFDIDRIAAELDAVGGFTPEKELSTVWNPGPIGLVKAIDHAVWELEKDGKVDFWALVRQHATLRPDYPAG